MLGRRAPGVLLGALLWLTPAPVLPTPSRSGPEGPPRPLGHEPPLGPTLPPGGSRAPAEDRVMLDGPFPSTTVVRGVSEGVLLLGRGEAVRRATLARIRAAGATVVRIPVDWRDTVEASASARFQASDPASPSYDFTQLDAAVSDAVADGLEPLLVVSHAPAFAEAPHRWPYAFPGSWDPDPRALEEFAVALARRYDGRFPDPQAPRGVLPRVRLFQAWNEPNLARYLEPQWVVSGGTWSAFSPLLYRQLLNAFYQGVKAVEPSDVVVTAGVAPNGERAGEGRMAPVTFLSDLLCLRGSGGVESGCGERAHFDVLAFHSLSVVDPDVPAGAALDVSIADADRVSELLRRAERLGTALPAGHKPLWVTELNWESGRGAVNGVPPSLQARWISRALHRLWAAGVTLVAWQFLVDPDPGVTLATPSGGTRVVQRPAGLYSAGPGDDPALARAKPFLEGFRFPLDPLRVAREEVRVWALPPRLPRPHAVLRLQRLDGARWRTIALLRVDRAGVVNALVRVRGAALLRLTSGSCASAPAPVEALSRSS